MLTAHRELPAQRVNTLLTQICEKGDAGQQQHPGTEAGKISQGAVRNSLERAFQGRPNHSVRLSPKVYRSSTKVRRITQASLSCTGNLRVGGEKGSNLLRTM